MKEPVLLYDGECGLCDRTVQRLLRWDRRARLKFAPLQSPAAQKFLKAHGLALTDFSTVVFVEDWNDRERSTFRIRSAAVAASMRECGGLANVGGQLLTRAIRDRAYDFVAKRRKQLFGGVDACVLMRPEWKARFLHGELPTR
jgi:predicted DCC family thiol-disulfide oxidoreductase YuxK